MSRSARETRKQTRTWSTPLVVSLMLAFLWIATGSALASRVHLVFSYDTQTAVPPALEIVAVSNVALLVLTLMAALFPWCASRLQDVASVRIGLGLGFLSLLPLLLIVLRCMGVRAPEPAIWEVVWFALLSGLSIGKLVPISWPSQHAAASHFPLESLWQGLLGFATACAFGWWMFQSHIYYQGFRLGFNDFGHFTQRIANTAAGRGFLLESPVLPPFWDHFNPGLVLLVPLWWLWPSVYGMFAVQALSLALPALVLASIVRRWGGSPAAATIWGLAWLLHPSIGQMNLAYTYGWHPVTVAVPLLLLAYRMLLGTRYWTSGFLAVIACSFEEGVIVVVGCFAAAMFLRSFFTDFGRDNDTSPLWQRGWLLIFMIAVVSFVTVYTTSGLARFQTGRFMSLGGTAAEIALSPVLKPFEFWGLLLRPRNAAFLCLIACPLLAAGLHRARWHLLSVALPTGVLLIWEHMPAQSIAFQYASCLIPILFLGAIEGSSRPVSAQSDATNQASETGPSLRGAAGVAMASCVLCVFVGQMPWSQDTLLDVLSRTYNPELEQQRRVGDEDHAWLAKQIEFVRGMKGAESDTSRTSGPTVLATGRIASHMVGLPDVETVEQFWQRREDLIGLAPSLASPLLRYEVILLDYRETFQQLIKDTKRVRAEALQVGFEITASQFEIELLTQKKQ